jgi:membrane fusion protein, heavy metal efflux system
MRVTTILPIVTIAALSLAIVWTDSHAHEDEDHNEPKPIPAVASAAPRTEAASERFELVAIASSGVLTIYLDCLRTNDAVTNATITVETPTGSIVASPEQGGTYKLAAPWAVTPGHYDLIFTVESDGTADVLAATLEVPTTVPLPQSASAGASDGLFSQLRQRIEERDPVLILTTVVGFVLGVAVMGLLARRKLIPAVALLTILVTILATAALAHEDEDHSPAVVHAAMPSARDLAKRLPDGSLFCAEAYSKAPCDPNGCSDERAASTHHRVAWADHPGSECKRICAGIRRRTPFCTSRRISPTRYTCKQRRCARICDASPAGH